MNGPVMCDYCQRGFASALAYFRAHVDGNCATEAEMEAAGMTSSRFGIWTLKDSAQDADTGRVSNGERL